MTNVGDVIRQVETVLNDTYYPPTVEQQEILNEILHRAYTGSVPAGAGR